MSSDLQSDLEQVADHVAVLGGRRDAWNLQRMWRATFAPDHQWKEIEFDWESIASDPSMGLSGFRAADAFWHTVSSLPRSALEVIATERLGSPPVFLLQGVSTTRLRSFLNRWDDDLYLTEASYRWSFIVTHEAPQIGPFFVQAEAE